MAIRRFLGKASFGPGEIARMTHAYDNALLEFPLSDQTERVAELVAKKIVEIARNGERNSVLICVEALKELGIRG